VVRDIPNLHERMTFCETNNLAASGQTVPVTSFPSRDAKSDNSSTCPNTFESNHHSEPQHQNQCVQVIRRR